MRHAPHQENQPIAGDDGHHGPHILRQMSAGTFCEALLHLATPHVGRETESAAAALDRLATWLGATIAVHASFASDPHRSALLLERGGRRGETSLPGTYRRLPEPWPGVLAAQGPTPRPLLLVAQRGTIHRGGATALQVKLDRLGSQPPQTVLGGPLPRRWGAVGPYLLVPAGPAAGGGGAIFLGRPPGARAFSDSDVVAATAVAAALRALNERSAAVRTSQRRGVRQQAFSTLMLALQHTTSIEHAVERAVDTFCDALDATTVSVWLTESPTGHATRGLRVTYAGGTQLRPDGSLEAPTEPGPFVRQTLSANAPLHYGDLARATVSRENPQAFARIRAAHTVLLRANRRTLGVVELGFATTHPLDEEGHDFLMSVTEPLAGTVARIEAARATARAHNLFRTTVEQSPLPILVFDEQGELVATSEQVWDRTGYGRDDLSTLGEWLTAAIRDPERRRSLRRHLDDAGVAHLGDYEITGADDTVATWSLTLGALQRNGQRSFRVLSGLDVTEQRIAEQHLQTTKKLEAIGQLAAGIAHDFKNSLQVILGYTQLAIRKLGASHPVVSLLEEVLVAGERERLVTAGLLAFSRNEPGESVALDPAEVTAQFLRHVRKMVPERIQFNVTLAPGTLPLVRCDPARLEEILLNLLVNAKEAIEDVGSIEWGAQLVPAGKVPPIVGGPALGADMVMLLVRDTGCGMSEDVRRRIFEPFFTTKEQGTGLGLATSFATLRHLGGDMRVATAPGEGTSFALFLPVASTPDTGTPQRSPNTDPPRGTEQILLVEDRQQIRDLARSTLTELGYRVLEAKDGVEALSCVADDHIHIDLLVTDVIMPRMGGPALAVALRKRFPQLRVIYMTGLSGAEVVSDGPLDGDGLLEKPFAPSRLALRIREVLDAP